MESRYEMQNNEISALAALEGGNDKMSARKLRSLANKAKKRLQQPNKAGITVDGQVLSDAQVIRIFNHIKDPSLLKQMKETLSDQQLNEIVEYIGLTNPDLKTLSEKLLDNYKTPAEAIQTQLTDRGIKGWNRFKITEEMKNDPLLIKAYGSRKTSLLMHHTHQ